jgi:DNA-binding transcriptional ArsR family regulator
MSQDKAISGSTTQHTHLPDAHAIRKTNLVFRALNHKLRQQILQLLIENEKMIVSDIFTKLLLEQSVASQHLATLRRTGFVKTKREGKFIWYMIRPERLEEIQQVIKILLK